MTYITGGKDLLTLFKIMLNITNFFIPSDNEWCTTSRFLLSKASFMLLKLHIIGLN